MPHRIKGETVTVLTRERTGTLPGNTPEYTDVETTVDNVLVAPGALSDVTGSIRPDGVKVAWELHFPKTFTGSLRGARVKVRGGPAVPVVGDPHPYTDANTPGAWNRPVRLELVKG
ncbi:MAG: hypothetical protein ACTII7_07775 [Galactobacter sp.]